MLIVTLLVPIFMLGHFELEVTLHMHYSIWNHYPLYFFFFFFVQKFIQANNK